VTEFTDPPVSEAAVSRDCRVRQPRICNRSGHSRVNPSTSRRNLQGCNRLLKSRGASKVFTQTANETAIPAVPVAESVTDDSVTCLCCGRSFTMLKRHLRAEHGLSEGDYRIKFNLDDDHPPCSAKLFFCAKRTMQRKPVWAAMPVMKLCRKIWGPSSKFKCLAPATVCPAEHLIDWRYMSLRQWVQKRSCRTGPSGRARQEAGYMAAKTQPRIFKKSEVIEGGGLTGGGLEGRLC